MIRRWHAFLDMQKKVVKQLHNIVTVSDCSRQDIARDFGLQPAGISLVHNGIDTEVFRPLPGSPAQAHAPDGDLLGGCATERPALPAAGLCAAVAAYPDLELLLVSKPQPGGKTEKLVAALGIADKVQFVSGISTEQMVRYYAEATIAVVPSVYEGFGLPAGEAMACGVPVVSTDGGALPEVVGDAGVIVPAKIVEALVEAIDALLRILSSAGSWARADAAHRREVLLAGVCAQMTDYYQQVLTCRRLIFSHFPLEPGTVCWTSAVARAGM